MIPILGYFKTSLLTILLIATSKTETKEINHYWWEYLNYYEILGLEGDDSIQKDPPKLETKALTNFHPNRRIIPKKSNLNLYYQRSKITSQHIKKSYRKEAQKFHPDKSSKDKRDEYTARFNRIKEAYDTLSNEDSRSAYEEELYYEEKIVLQERNHLLNNIELWDENDEEEEQYRPINVYEKHEHGYDSNTNMPILRIYKREEFPRGMYRIWMQDFVHSQPPVPLGPPHLVEEYMHRENQFHNSYKTNSNNNIPYQLHNGESTKILQSSNELYRAKLTYDCELVIVRRKPLPHLKSKIVWSSRTYLVPKEEDEETPQCFFMFVNRQMIVYTSSSVDENDRRIVWHSKPPPLHALNDTSSSFLVLENDGVLSIYFHSNTTNPYDTRTKTSNKMSLPSFFQRFNSTKNVIPFVNTQQQIYCTKASQLWNSCYQKAMEKLPIIDIYSKKTANVIQKVAHQTNPTVKRITHGWYESYQNTMLSIQNKVVKLTQTSIYHPRKGDNSTNLLCIWSTNGCTPFPILRLVRFAFLAIQYQLVRNTQRVIHSISNQRKRQDYEYYDDDDNFESINPVEWIGTFGKQIYRWGKNTIYDLFGNDDDYLEDDEEDYMLNVYLRNKMNRWKDTMNHRMDMPF